MNSKVYIRRVPVASHAAGLRAVHERPRERLARNGAAALSDVELLAILLGSGVKGRPVLNIAAELLPVIDLRNLDVGIDDLGSIPGVGAARASLLIAALEFARRRIRPAGTRIRNASDVYQVIRHLASRKQEAFITVTLNGAHELIATRVITLGTLNQAPVHPREVFADAITDRAASIIVAHNHPSGELLPSGPDVEVTKRLSESGTLLGIPVLDHLIFDDRGFYSFADHGQL